MKPNELDLTEAGSLYLHGSVEIIRHGEECPFKHHVTYNDHNYQVLFELETYELIPYGRVGVVSSRWKIKLREV